MEFAEGRMKKKVLGAVEAIGEGVGQGDLRRRPRRRADHARARRRRNAHCVVQSAKSKFKVRSSKFEVQAQVQVTGSSQRSDSLVGRRRSKNAFSAGRPRARRGGVRPRGRLLAVRQRRPALSRSLVRAGRRHARSLPSARERGDRRQAATLISVPTFSTTTCAPRLPRRSTRCCRRICRTSFCANSGAEAVDGALKFARLVTAASGVCGHDDKGLPRPDVRRAVGDVGAEVSRGVRPAARNHARARSTTRAPSRQPSPTRRPR